MQTLDTFHTTVAQDNHADLLRKWTEECKAYSVQGECATYIPELAKANPQHLGVCILNENGMKLNAGEWNIPFTMQSISKVISFIAACIHWGIDEIMKRVDVEPTGDAFNSIVRLESDKPCKPFNPMINAGAITVSSLLPGKGANEKISSVLDLLEEIVGRRLVINEEVYQSEWKTTSLNRSLAYYLEGKELLETSVEETLETYIKQCSIEVTCEDLAMIGLVLANGGFHPFTNRQIIPKEICKVSKALMLTCGLYNYSGKFSAFVGIPAKSGVSGGMMACVPARSRSTNFMFFSNLGVGIYGPAIDEYGNSIAGVKLLELLSNKWDLHIF